MGECKANLDVAPATPPIPIPPHMDYGARAVAFHNEVTLPHVETHYIGGPGNTDAKVELTEEEWDAYSDLHYELRANQNIHQMLGHADDVQPYAPENSYEEVRRRLPPRQEPLQEPESTRTK